MNVLFKINGSSPFFALVTKILCLLSKMNVDLLIKALLLINNFCHQNYIELHI